MLLRLRQLMHILSPCSLMAAKSYDPGQTIRPTFLRLRKRLYQALERIDKYIINLTLKNLLVEDMNVNENNYKEIG